MGFKRTGIVCLVFSVALLAASLSAQTPGAGKQQFEARCVGCHGSDGGGGGHGPSILDIRRPRAASKEALRRSEERRVGKECRL